MPMGSRSHTYRLKALESERRAREASDPATRREWEELAIQWHAMAHASTPRSGELV